MWRSKKFIIITVLVAVVLVGGIGGVAFAQSGHDRQDSYGVLLGKVAEKLGINEQVLRDAFTEARSELQAEHPEGKPHHGPGGAIFEGFGVDQEALQAAFEQARSELGAGTLEGGRWAVMSRVLEILGISEEEWQAACSEARESCPEMRPGDPPEGRPQFDHGFGFRGPGGRPHGPGGFGGLPDTQ